MQPLTLLLVIAGMLSACAKIDTPKERSHVPEVIFGSLAPKDWEAQARIRVTYEKTLVLRYSEGKLSWAGGPIVERDVASYVNGLLKTERMEQIAIRFSSEVKIQEAMEIVDRLRATTARTVIISGEF